MLDERRLCLSRRGVTFSRYKCVVLNKVRVECVSSRMKMLLGDYAAFLAVKALSVLLASENFPNLSHPVWAKMSFWGVWAALLSWCALLLSAKFSPIFSRLVQVKVAALMQLQQCFVKAQCFVSQESPHCFLETESVIPKRLPLGFPKTQFFILKHVPLGSRRHFHKKFLHDGVLQ